MIRNLLQYLVSLIRLK